MKPLKVRISITLDDPIYQKIKGLAEYDDRSVSSYINLALRDHLELWVKGPGPSASATPPPPARRSGCYTDCRRAP